MDCTPALIIDLMHVLPEINKAQDINAKGLTTISRKECSKFIKLLSKIIKQLAEITTTQSTDYKVLQMWMQQAFENYFGCYAFDVSIECSLFY